MSIPTISQNRIKELREESKLTQLELAKLMDLTPSTVNKHENALRRLTEEGVRKYAAIFKVPTHHIFCAPLTSDLTDSQEEGMSDADS